MIAVEALTTIANAATRVITPIYDTIGLGNLLRAMTVNIDGVEAWIGEYSSLQLRLDERDGVGAATVSVTHWCYPESVIVTVDGRDATEAETTSIAARSEQALGKLRATVLSMPNSHW